jgi:hypothetical protein
VKQEAAKKLLSGHGHQPLLALVGIVFLSECDVAIGKVDEPVIGDSDTMRVTGQVLENVLRSSETPFGVDKSSRDETVAEEKNGNKYVFGFIQRQYSRNVSSSFGLNGTSRSRRPLP